MLNVHMYWLCGVYRLTTYVASLLVVCGVYKKTSECAIVVGCMGYGQEETSECADCMLHGVWTRRDQ